MSPKITSLTAAGLTALGLTWAATPGVAKPQDPPATPAPDSVPSVPPTPTAPSSLATAPGSEANPTVLLLSNGHVLQGEILQDATGYFLKHRIGVKHYSRRQVLGAFDSLEAAYRFKLARLPQEDADEQMKLAVWCLEQDLGAHAREHLDAVLDLSPENHRARAMIFQLNAGNAPPTDPAISQTGGTMVETDPAAPRELSINTIRNLDRDRPAAGPPIIFDLPAPIAYRRYQEFGRTVHVELQRHCARCHNADSYGGDFRLVFARARRDLQNDTLIRTNLDAVLRLVNPADLAHSELLSITALTHPPDGRPVLGGPNHPSYRVLLNWVNSLSDPASAASGLAPAEALSSIPTPMPIEGFAAGRTGPIGPGGPEPIPGTGPTIAPPPQVVGGMTGRFTVSDPSVPADAQFPDPSRYRVTPNAIGPRVMPPRAEAPAAPVSNPAAPVPAAPVPAAPGTMAPPPGQPGSLVQLPDGQTGMVLPDGQVVPFVSSESLRRPSPPPAVPVSAPALPPPTTAPAPTPKAAGSAAPQLNNDALQNFLINRAGSN